MVGRENHLRKVRAFICCNEDERVYHITVFGDMPAAVLTTTHESFQTNIYRFRPVLIFDAEFIWRAAGSNSI